jgi:sodium-dependent dicarboxylate transporter 2/3/5
MTVFGLLLWMVVWWVGQVIAIHITALLPIVIIPIFTDIQAKALSLGYAHPIIFLILGGSLFAIAFEITGLNKRIALSIINIIGFSKRKIILSIIIATAFISMWISNASATITMLPVVITIFNHVNQASTNDNSSYKKCLLLVLAHSASIGGIATLIGTPPNAVLASQAKLLGNIKIEFVDWLMIGLPVAITGLTIMYFMMTRVIFKITDDIDINLTKTIEKEYKELGKISYNEKIIITLFSIIIFFWLFKSSDFIKNLLPIAGSLTDTSIIMTGAILLFIIKGSQKTSILSWSNVVNNIPWSVLILIGGGIALTVVLKSTNIMPWVGSYIDFVGVLPLLALLILIALIITFLTEVNSNTATTIILIPVVWTLATNIGIDPMLLATTVAITASSAFMLPTATVPNAIIFNSNDISVMNMARSGVLLNLTIAPVFAILVYFIY